MKKAFLAILAVILLPLPGQAQKRHKTTRPRAELRETVAGNPRDTLPAIGLDSLILAGYDKPLRSRRETMFVTNRTGRRLTRLFLSIRYCDTSGRQLHQRIVETGVDIPSGETRMISFPSWDRQLTFVYIHSEQPVRSRATPYDIKVTVTKAEISSR